MSTHIEKIQFEADLLPLVADFDCSEVPGNPTFWEEEINEWIRMDPATNDGALHYMQQGTHVWLYFNENRGLVGYSSLGVSKWPDPNVLEKVPRAKRVPINLTPAVGIHWKFLGGPADVDPHERYSSKIMEHVIFEARKNTDLQPFLGLYVHPMNRKAIRFYERVGFERFHQTFHHEQAGCDYLSYILKLAVNQAATEAGK
jgi:GNAT superfamily N-acetyltransferase